MDKAGESAGAPDASRAVHLDPSAGQAQPVPLAAPSRREHDGKSPALGPVTPLSSPVFRSALAQNMARSCPSPALPSAQLPPPALVPPVSPLPPLSLGPSSRPVSSKSLSCSLSKPYSGGPSTTSSSSKAPSGPSGGGSLSPSPSPSPAPALAPALAPEQTQSGVEPLRSAPPMVSMDNMRVTTEGEPSKRENQPEDQNAKKDRDRDQVQVHGPKQETETEPGQGSKQDPEKEKEQEQENAREHEHERQAQPTPPLSSESHICESPPTSTIESHLEGTPVLVRPPLVDTPGGSALQQLDNALLSLRLETYEREKRRRSAATKTVPARPSLPLAPSSSPPPAPPSQPPYPLRASPGLRGHAVHYQLSHHGIAPRRSHDIPRRRFSPVPAAHRVRARSATTSNTPSSPQQNTLLEPKAEPDPRCSPVALVRSMPRSSSPAQVQNSEPHTEDDGSAVTATITTDAAGPSIALVTPSAHATHSIRGKEGEAQQQDRWFRRRSLPRSPRRWIGASKPPPPSPLPPLPPAACTTDSDSAPLELASDLDELMDMLTSANESRRLENQRAASSDPYKTVPGYIPPSSHTAAYASGEEAGSPSSGSTLSVQNVDGATECGSPFPLRFFFSQPPSSTTTPPGHKKVGSNFMSTPRFFRAMPGMTIPSLRTKRLGTLFGRTGSSPDLTPKTERSSARPSRRSVGLRAPQRPF